MSYPTAAGRLNREVTVIAPGGQVNDYGNAIESNDTLWLLTALISQEPMSSDASRVIWTVEIRYFDDISRQHGLITDTGIRLEILSIDPQPEVDKMVLRCSQPDRLQ